MEKGMRSANALDLLRIAASQKKKEKDYWLKQLSGHLVKSIFPPDNKAKPFKHRHLHAVTFTFPGQVFSRLITLSKGSDAPLYVILVAGLKVLLKRYSGSNDIITGAPVIKQRQADARLINTILAFRDQLQDQLTFRQLLSRVKQTIRQATENQNYPLEILPEDLGMGIRTPGEEFPLFDTAVLLENIHDKKDIQHMNLNMTFSFLRTHSGLEGTCEYNSHCYHQTTIKRITANLVHLFQEVLFDLEKKLCALDILSREEKKQILFELNHTKKEIPRDKNYHQLFEEQVRKTPGNLGAIHHRQQMTYEELNREANGIAYYLREHGVKPGDMVGLYIKRSIHFLTCIIGVFKTGAAYLPLDTDYPVKRVQIILEESESSLLITGIDQEESIKSLHPSLPHLQHTLYLEDHKKAAHPLSKYPKENPRTHFHPDNLAYVIYTSGTTGKPKGVMIHQLGMMNHLYANIDFLSVTAADIIAQTASPCFDISVWQFLAGVITGGITCIIDKEMVIDPGEFIKVLQQGKITILELVPSLMFALLDIIRQKSEKDRELKSLRWVLPTGETLSTALAKDWYKYYPHIPLVNAYGPAEASDDVTLYIVNKHSLDHQPAIPIGKPLQNLHIYILDHYLSLCPIGVSGEICISGIGVGKGYLKDAPRTHQAFIPNPFLHEIHDPDYAVLYRTGDMGFYRPDGNIEFIGRLDHQVKIRGNRIELEEIENVLVHMEEIKTTAVLVEEDENQNPGQQDKHLTAYFTADKLLEISQLRAYLSEKLPHYMIPSYFKQIEKMPLTPNGKIDRKALPGLAAEDQWSHPVNRLTRLLEQAFFTHPLHISTRNIQVLPEEEKTRILLAVNRIPPGDADTRDQASMKTLHGLFEHQADKSPGRIAVGDMSRQLTYRELNEKSNRLAQVLRTRGVTPGTIVGILVRPSIEMVVGILAVLKSGGAYALIDPGDSPQEILHLLETYQPAVLLTQSKELKNNRFTALQNLHPVRLKPLVTGIRPQVKNLDDLPIPDRSLLDYEKYSRYIGQAMVKNTYITLLGTRGCPFNCAYCHKIWPKKHVVRSAENILEEVMHYYKMGVRRFVIIDDIFNLDVKNSSRFFQGLIKNRLNLQLFFPNGMRGDLFTREYIDLMVEAGLVNVALALETASPRLQKMIKKNLDIDRFHSNCLYMCETYPQVISEIFIMHGFPGETEKEAMMTMDFIKSLKWIHFPYINILRIFPNTDMEKLAIQQGISPEAIFQAESLAYHEIPDILPFEKSFTRQYQTHFLNEYFLSKERLLHVLPYQMKILTQYDMVQKYDTYLPSDINSFDELLRIAGIHEDEFDSPGFLPEDHMLVANFEEKLKENAPARVSTPGALKILLLDLSQFFSSDAHMLYDLYDPPLGLIYLLTYLYQQWGSKIKGKIAKSRVDFDSYQELKTLVLDFEPDIIGMRALTFHKDFFHQIAALLRHWGIEVPVAAGGPYATSGYQEILQDPNINLVVLGEGEITFNQLIGKMIENNGKLPDENVLKKIAGIAFIPGNEKIKNRFAREIIIIDEIKEKLSHLTCENLENINKTTDLAWINYASPGARKWNDVKLAHYQVKGLISQLQSKYKDTGNKGNGYTKGNDLPVVSYVFDGSAPQVFGALLQGGTIYITPGDIGLKGGILLEYYIKKSPGKTSADICLLAESIQEKELRLEKPMKGIEKKCAHIWSEVLGIEIGKIRPGDDFFERGGNSLKAVTLASKIHKELEVKLSLVEIFKTPTVKGLAECINRAAADITGKPREKFVSIEPVEEKEYYELSSAQKRLYILQQVETYQVSYNVPIALEMEGKIDIKKLKEIFASLIRRHESFRTCFRLVESMPVQVIRDTVRFDLEYHESNRQEAKDLLKSFMRPFDLAEAPLLRGGVIKIEDNTHILVLSLHHIITDGFSEGILVNDFSALYSGEELPGLRIQYKDFTRWQNDLFASPRIKKQEKYWQDKYPGEIPILNLPTDYPRPVVQSFAGDFYILILSPQDARPFKALGAEMGATLYMNLHALFNVLVYKYTGQEDLVIGSDNAGRSHLDLNAVVGMFVNMLAMRNYPRGEITYRDFLKEVKNNSLEAFENQDVQFEALVDQLKLERDPSRNPLFDVVFVLHDFEYLKKANITSNVEGITFRFFDFENKTSIFDLGVEAWETDTGISFCFRYCTKLFKPKTIKRMAGHFVNILKEVVKNPDIQLSHIKMLNQQEKQQMLYQFNHTRKDITKDKCFHELFAEQVEKTPHQIAAVEKDRSITYQCLHEKTNQLANYLYIEKNTKPDSLVGIWMKRSIDFLAALLGIMKAGAAYVPLDPFLPGERIKKLIDNADLRMVISQRMLIKNVNRLQWECETFNHYICMDSWDVYQEEEESQKEWKNKEKVWEYVGQTASNEITGGGWLTSYTGQPFTKKEMDEYGDNILIKLTPLLHKQTRVLEIGCASGITMYRLAPKVGLYYAIDYSRVIIEKNKQRIKNEGHENIVLEPMAAHEIHRIKEKNFDLVIVNSVIQFFPGHNYFRKVVRKAVDLLGDQGLLFIGDVMDQDSKKDYIREMADFSRANKDKNYRTKKDFSIELYLSRGFFKDLVIEILHIQGVEFSNKIHTIENELTKFRYDALIKIDKTQKTRIVKKEKQKEQHDLRALAKYSARKLKPGVSPGNLAYVIYTSGTTGTPKGVMIHHLGMLNHLYAKINDLCITPKDIIAQTASACFDISVWQFLAGLLTGGSTFIIDRETVLDTQELLQVLQKGKITVWESVPSLMTAFLDMIKYKNEKERALNHLRWMIFTGEALPPPLVKEWHRLYPGIKALNAYGPTEAADDITHYMVEEIPPANQTGVPIGKPIQNTHIYILDRDLALCPIGIRGEICTAGLGVGRGYWKDPDKTKRSFIPNPFAGEIQEPGYTVVYKTGDIGYFKEDGNIQCLGRLDHQVKIRGNRIELGEIEHQLLKHDDITEAVVIAASPPRESRERYLCAYVVSPRTISVPGLRDHLSEQLPEYMVPSDFIQLEKIPLTPGGKIDRNSLPQRGFTLNKEYIAPKDRVEKTLAVIWSEVLDRETEEISRNANFFDLGGHSLRATILTNKIHQQMEVKVPLAEVFKSPTLQGLAQYIKNTETEAHRPLQMIEKKEYYRMSSTQKRLYLLQQMDLNSTGYNAAQANVLTGELHREKLERTFREMIKRHESLRTSFDMVNEEPVQQIHDEVEFEIEYYHLATGDTGNTGKRITSLPTTYYLLPTKNFIRPFDLSRAPLLRVGLMELQSTPAPLRSRPSQEGKKHQYILMLDMHHIITDGTSMDLFVRESMALYDTRELPPLKFQYKDYAQWQATDPQKQAIKQQEKYWLQQFASEVPVLNLPLDYPRPSVQSFAGDILSFELPVEITRALNQLASDTGSTLYMVLLAIYNILLSKISSQEDIIVGTPIAARRHADLERIIGMFVNTLVMRNYPKGNKEFIKFLAHLNQRTLEAFENQEYQFEDLVEKVFIQRDISRNPLFDTMFILQNMEVQADDIPIVDISQIRITPYETPHHSAKFDITLNCFENRGKLLCSFEYGTKLFKKNTIRKLIIYFKQILSSILKNRQQKISRIEIITAKEKQQILYDFNNTRVQYPKDKTLPQLFAEQVQRTPDSISLWGSTARTGKTVQFTYRELNKRSRELAELLIEKRVPASSIVGMIVHRNLEMIVGILGILKAGGAYLPIDPGYPQERINYMLADSKVKVLLVEPGTRETVKNEERFIEIIDISHLSSLSTLTSASTCQVSPRDLAYVIYTSGSTGKPNGVMIEHRAVHNFITGMAKVIDFAPGKTIMALTTISFDIFVLETLLPLCQGLRVVIADERHQRDLYLLAKLIIKSGAEMVQATPTRMQTFIRSGSKSILSCLARLQELMVGGEPFPGTLLEDLKQSTPARIYNMYGPTETTVWSTLKDVTLSAAEKINIGKPITNTRIYILSKFLNLQPVGIVGDLYIGGHGLSRGYINNPEQTAEKFDRDLWDYHDSHEKYHRSYRSHTSYISYLSYISRKIYKTGDLAKWLSDGNIQFLGRVDHQVKIRGFRIELQDIETQLLAYDSIKEAVVTARPDQEGDQYLCAYIIAEPNAQAAHPLDIDATELRKYLSARLPDYMTPAYFVILDSFPLTPNGKIDRKALPRPGLVTQKNAYIPPGNKIEKKLAVIWSEVLNREKEKISIDDNFFNLGGHSLRATILTARIHKQMHVKVPFLQIFKYPTIRAMAQYIKDAETEAHQPLQPIGKKEYYRLSSAQKRLYVLQQIELNSTGYNIVDAYILQGTLNREKLENTFRELIARHESLRTSFNMVKEEPVQQIHEEVEFEIEYYNLATEGVAPPTYNYSRNTQVPGKKIWNENKVLQHSNTGKRITSLPTTYYLLPTKNFIRPFDLSRAPLLRVGIIQEQEQKHILMIDMHHIVTDGTSMELFVKESMALYAGEELPPLKFQYKDYSQWQNSPQQKNAIKTQEEYWLKQFADGVPLLDLPLDYPRPLVQSFEGDSLSYELAAGVTPALKQLALESGTTLYMLLLAIFYVLLSKISSQEDIVIGTPIAGRRHADLEKIIGMFVNTLAMRNQPRGEKSFSLFLNEVKEQTLEAFENQDYPFEDLVDRAAVTRNPGRNPLFDTMFTLDNIDTTKIEITGLVLTPYQYKRNLSKFDLTLSAVEVQDRICFTYEYCTKLFKKETIQGFITYLKRIISSIIENPGEKISGIEIITGEERKQLLHDFNASAAAWPKDKALHQLFQEQAAAAPHHTILIQGEKQVTYKELNGKANQLARLLRARGLAAHINVVVGLMVKPSPAMVVGILGILKAGAAYLPIDPAYPEKRKKHMLKDSKARLSICHEPGSDINDMIANPRECEFINIGNDYLTGDSSDPEVTFTPLDLIYTIFTSGSTGKPKGAGVYHRSFLNLVYWYVKEFAFNANDSVLLITSLSFDLTQKNIFAPLITGGKLHLPEEHHYNHLSVSQTLWKKEITWLNCTPGMFYPLVEEEENFKKLTSLRYVFLGGEPIALPLINRCWQNDYFNAELVNIYGPTECTDVCSYYRIKRPGKFNEELASIPIGKPISNVQLFVLDSYWHPQPLGLRGELFIGGQGLGIGYLNDISMTSEKFITISLETDQKRQLYRTGDLARWLPAGNLEFLGRIDQQVKVRGFRIELGEIENQMMDHPEINECLVVPLPGKTGDKYLCAYIVSNRQLEIPALKEYLAKSLPAYMIPLYFLFLDRIPLNPNGKINRSALPLPQLKTAQQCTTPKNRLEKTLVELWAKLLRIEKSVIGTDSDFFELGGHSLNATIMTAKVHKQFHVRLPLAEIFKNPTISGLAQYIGTAARDRYTSLEVARKKEYYPLSSAQKRLYVLQQMAPGSTTYNIQLLKKVKGELPGQKLETIFRKFIKRHEILRTSFEMVKEEPVQKIHPGVEFAIEFYDFSAKAAEKKPKNEETSQELGVKTCITNFLRPFDLTKAPLMRVGLIKTNENEHILIVDMHHIIMDGISQGILEQEFIALYHDRNLPPLTLQYKDYSEWQNSDPQKQALKQQEMYWLQTYQEEIPMLNLPLDCERPRDQSFEGSSAAFTVDSEQTRKLKNLASEQGATLYIVLLSLYYVLLTKISSQEDIVVGTPVSGRNHSDLEPVIGMFVNTLALRNFPSPGKTFTRFLQEVKQKTLEAFDNQDYPFEELVDKLNIPRDTGRNPLFDAMFAFENQQEQPLHLHENTKVKIEPYPYENQTAKFDIVFSAVEEEHDLHFLIEYSTKLFKKETIKRLAAYFQDIVTSVLNNSNVKLKDIEISLELTDSKSAISHEAQGVFGF